MGSSCQDVAQTVTEIVGRRPVLAPVLRAFEPLLEAREAVSAELVEVLRDAGVHLPEFQCERAINGVPLLADMPMTGMAAGIRRAAEAILPLLLSLQAVAPHKTALEKFFFQPVTAGDVDSREELGEILLTGSTEAFAKAAGKCGVPPEELDFVAGFVLSPALRALAKQANRENGEFPWDTEGAWHQGYCPVCGTFPSIAWLDRPALDEKNAYLSGGGGKKHLHCSLCGTNWKFRRGACPSCGKEGAGTMEILHESSGACGERLDWCTQCRSYCPTVDLREREGIPHMDAMSLGMMHLDMVASRRKLRPLKPSFWNMF